MGKAWADTSPEARNVLEEADAALGMRFGAPLSQICFSGPVERLNQTDVAQPALFVVAVASWKALIARWGFGNGESAVAAAAGLSLGEYTALHLAGVFSFRNALDLVTLRGQAMQDAATAQHSGMVALVGADESQAQAICDQARAAEVLVAANFNAPGQIVLSGHKAACERAAKSAADMGLRAQPLAVAGAFHSPLMAPAAERLRAALAKVDLRPPRFPVVSNVTARPHDPTPDSIRRLLVQQLTSPVRWAESCQWLVQNAKGQYHELAPGKTLAGLFKRIDRSIKVESHDQPSQSV
jgi:[acyl-carrier-protein] S-malonyltransferase